MTTMLSRTRAAIAGAALGVVMGKIAVAGRNRARSIGG